MKKKIFALILITVICLTGCKLFNKGPADEVKMFLNKYKNNDTVVVNELNDYLSKEDFDEDTLKDYREIYLRQYSNLDYIIKDETINGDEATVTVQITVYDYYKTNKESGDYFTSNQNEFVNDKGDVDLGKYYKYKMKKLLDTTEKVNYTLTLKLTKVENKWEIEPLSAEQLTKLHGTYEY